jgi:hypothetical protein
MAATKSQGTNFTLFMFGLTAVCAGIAFFDEGIGKLALAAGLIVLAVGFAGFLKIKPLEGKTGVASQPAVMKAIGVLVVVGGWLFVLLSLHLATGTGARLVTSVLGLIISLAGIFFILAPAASKNAIWKA